MRRGHEHAEIVRLHHLPGLHPGAGRRHLAGLPGQLHRLHPPCGGPSSSSASPSWSSPSWASSAPATARPGSSTASTSSLLFSFVVFALLFFIVFATPSPTTGRGQVVMNRRFLEYQLSDYNGWLKICLILRPAVLGHHRRRLRDGHACKGDEEGRARPPTPGMMVAESPAMFAATGTSRRLRQHVLFLGYNLAEKYRAAPVIFPWDLYTSSALWIIWGFLRILTPFCDSQSQSGCCKPPSSCGFTYNNETFWTPIPGSSVADLTATGVNEPTGSSAVDSCKETASRRASRRAGARWPSSTSLCSSSCHRLCCGMRRLRNAKRDGQQQSRPGRDDESRPAGSVLGSAKTRKKPLLVQRPEWVALGACLSKYLYWIVGWIPGWVV
ncbi:hypothetical protein QYE76_009168 [Lolium multiflorum]|uniref:Uncharacterized protein n=1 Tax=Lolium multiflorum TaxID=4521 RepID=A0AAD8TSN5_LOLMU|nr:hypothetical protein QYE76_009168 [Lolium multiflorum]